MITRDALYAFIESLINTAEAGDALYDAVSYRNLRTSVDQTDQGRRKVVRVDCIAGNHNVAGVDGDRYRETNVISTVQCWVTPDIDAGGTDEEALDDAKDVSFEMSREISDAIAADPHLNNTVCHAVFMDFETGEANIKGRLLGVTYLDGIVNSAQEG